MYEQLWSIISLCNSRDTALSFLQGHFTIHLTIICTFCRPKTFRFLILHFSGFSHIFQNILDTSVINLSVDMIRSMHIELLR